jgi:phospholipid/cholesterol/gamma-HCH transport system permease protein
MPQMRQGMRKDGQLTTQPAFANITANSSTKNLSPTTLLAGITKQKPAEWALSGEWTARSLAQMPQQLEKLHCESGEVVLDGAKLDAIDSAGVWLLQRWLLAHHATSKLRDWPPALQKLMLLVAESAQNSLPPQPRKSALESVGRVSISAAQQAFALLAFTGETALAAVRLLAHPKRIRWRILLRNIQIGGFNALPIIGLTSFLLGVVIAYQGADQLKHYGANIFVVELIGYAMLREFAPLISAIIIAGRSGSAYAAAIGTMVVTEEIDAMRTIDIDPIEFLVLPKIAALAVALPLLTVFADLTGVFGGMVMARSQLGIGFHEFIDRFGREIPTATLLVGIGKSLVFAIIIAGIGCFQGFRTKGSADSVGRQTTTSVVQAIFLVIVVDALFSVVFSLLDI